MSDPFEGLPRGHFGVVYADPPWHWKPWADVADTGGSANIARDRSVEKHYDTMSIEEIAALPVAELCRSDAVLLMWFTWPLLRQAFTVLDGWGFTYKTCGFAWVKANGTQIEMFDESMKADMTLGFWTRANSEACLLATRGHPKRLNADVRQAIIEPRRQHSRKPDCVYGRIERLVAGPYLEMFARTQRAGWSSWGNQTDKFASVEQSNATPSGLTANTESRTLK